MRKNMIKNMYKLVIFNSMKYHFLLTIIDRYKIKPGKCKSYK